MQGPAAKDASGRGCHAWFEKAPNDPKWYKYGRFGGCLAFDGESKDENGDKKGDADGLIWEKGGAPDPKGAGFTVEMWVRHADLTRWQFYLLRRGGGVNYGFVAKRNKLYVGFKPAGGKWIEVWSDACLKVNVWQHVAFTYDKKVVRIYCDGVERGHTDVVGKLGPGGKGYALFCHDSDRRPSQIRGLGGMMDEVRISNIARTDFPKGPYKPRDALPKLLQKAKRFIEPTPLARDVTVTGVVFEDRNGNGKRDAGEKGIRGAHVTDGERIKVSPLGGAYEFEFKVEEYRFVYITLPRGYKAAGPWYHLIKQDDTATEYQFDFALQADRASLDRNFSFMVGADSQFSSAAQGRLLTENMAQITRSTGRPRFFFNCGDLTMTGWLSEWNWYVKAMRELTIPSYQVYGGHGGNYGRYTRLKTASVHHFNQFVGPGYSAWNYGGRHFIIYNSWGGMSRAGRARQEKWIKADLAQLKPGAEVIISAHQPVNVRRWRRDIKHVASFYGHWHENNLFYFKEVPYICTHPLRGRDWGTFTKTIRFCTFKDGKLITELRPCGQHKRVLLIYPQNGGELPQSRAPLRVSAFDTASRVMQVTAEIAPVGEVGGTQINLRRIGPFTWGTDLDTTKMPPGAYSIRIAVKDDRPESWPVKSGAFKIEARPPVKGKPGEDWPMVFKGLKELRTTKNEVKPPLELVWTVPTSGRNQWATSPIVYRGRVYVGPENANTGRPEPTIECYEAATGKHVWKTELDARIRFSMAAADGRVFAQTSRGTAYCLDANTGRVVWRKRMFPMRCNPTDAKCSVILYQGKLITFAEYGPLVIFDAQSGKKLASWPRPGRGTRVYYGGPFPDGDRIWISTLHGAFACDMMTGKPIWQANVRKWVGRGVAMGVAQDGIYYTRGYNGVVAFRAADGKKLWEAKNHTAGVVPIPTIADGILYAGGSDAIALDIKTGKKLWSYYTKLRPDEHNRRQERLGGHSSPLVSGNLVYLGRDDGDIVALDRHTGKRVWCFDLGLPIKSSPVVSGNMLFVYGFDGNLYAFASGSK